MGRGDRRFFEGANDRVDAPAPAIEIFQAFALLALSARQPAPGLARRRADGNAIIGAEELDDVTGLADGTVAIGVVKGVGDTVDGGAVLVSNVIYKKVESSQTILIRDG